MKLRSQNLTCLLISSVIMSGCVHGDGLASAKNLSQAITDEAIYISQARKNATNGIIFSNILEARDRGIGDHNIVTGVQSNPTSSSEITATLDPLGLGNPGAELEASTGGVTRGAEKSGTFSINPAGTGLDEGGGPLLQPVAKSIFENYWASNWPKDVLLSLLVRNYTVGGTEEYNGGKNPSHILYQLTDHFGTLNNITLKNPKKPIVPRQIKAIDDELKALKDQLKKAPNNSEQMRLQEMIDSTNKKLWLTKKNL